MPEPLPKKSKFQADTKHSNIFKLRGTISAIDEALDAWHKHRTLDNTILVYKECRHWLKAKEGKTTENSLHRQRVITYLADQTMVWMQFLDPNLWQALLRFDTKKAAGAKPLTQPLSGVYQHEQSLYAASGKTHAPSGTILDNKFHQYANHFPGKQFKDLTEAEYAQLDHMLKQRHGVVYLKKLERLRNMIYVENRQLTAIDGTLLSTTGAAGWPYAIDKYGNMFTTDDRAAQGQFNHSSFNAGNEVLCAGMIEVNAGVLVSISNNSGHYKPTQQNLHNVVLMLMRELGRAASAAKAQLWTFNVPGWIVIYEFPFAMFPAAGLAGGVEVHRMPAH